MTFEGGFVETEKAALVAIKAASTLAVALRQLHKAAMEGDILKLNKLSERLAILSESVRQDVKNTRSAWPFLPDTEETYLRDSYEKELVDAAKAEGLQIYRRDDGLVAFPSILRILPTERAVKIDRKKIHGLRPSRLAKSLKANQSKKPRFAPEQFLEVLHGAYHLLAGKDNGTTVALASLYEAFTLLPGTASSYDKTDFARDLFLLDRSGVTRTKSGAVVSFPASTGTRGSRGIFSFAGPDGEDITYYGIRFVEDERT